MYESLGAYDLALDTASGALAIFAFGLLAAELLWLFGLKRLNRGRILEMLASYSTLVPYVLVELATAGFWLAVYAGLAALVPWEIPTTWWSALAAVLLADLVYYWEHRLEHRVRVLWAVYHSVHHSSPDFNQATAYRVSFADHFVPPLFYLPLVAIGFHPFLVLSALIFILAYQTWLHTEMIGRLGWLDRIFNTPSNHRVHHGADPKYRDRNLGAFLIVWDRLFGTYQAEEETPVYGLATPLASVNPLKVHFHEAVGLCRDLARARNLRRLGAVLFGRPL